MPRNSSGTYSLPAGNPVVTATVISSTWANTTMTDLGNALTDSLSRSGDGGMTAPLGLDDGAIGAPGLMFTSESTSGLYRAGAGDFRWAIGGADVFRIVAGALRLADGSAATPSLSFASDVDTGMWWAAANDVRIGAGGTAGIRILNTGGTVQGLFQDGTAALPAISFSGDVDTGLYRFGTNEFRAVVAGAPAFSFFDNAGQAQALAVDGVVGKPGLSFLNDPDTGLYRVGANTLALSCGGAVAMAMDTTSVIVSANHTLFIQDGAVGTPGIRFDNDSNTGMYRTGADTIGFSGGGVRGLQVDGGHIYIEDGTVGAPSVRFNSDLDTGIYLPGANTFNIGAGGQAIASFTTAGIAFTKQLELTVNSANLAVAGGASALPSNPVGYFAITLNGTQRRVPYYAD